MDTVYNKQVKQHQLPDKHSLSLRIGQGDDCDEDERYDVHLDIRDLPGIDVVCAWQRASFPGASFDLVFSSQTIEHLSKQDQVTALRNTFSWLKPGGVLDLWTPNLVTQVSWLQDGRITWSWFQKILYGEQDYRENTHLFCHTPESLQALVSGVGFEVCSCDDVEGSIHLVARKPA